MITNTKHCPCCCEKARMVSTAGRFHCDTCGVGFLIWTDAFEKAAPNHVGYAFQHLCDAWPTQEGDGCWNCEEGIWLPEVSKWYCDEASGGGCGDALTKEQCWSNLTGDPEEGIEDPDEGWSKRQ